MGKGGKFLEKERDKPGNQDSKGKKNRRPASYFEKEGSIIVSHPKGGEEARGR